MSDPDSGKRCPTCGFAWERPGLRICPRCVLSTQFEEGQGDERSQPFEDEVEGERAHLVPGYVIGEVLGRGGCGTVYKATQTALDRPVAIKFLRQDRAVSRERLETLRGESVSLAKLQHPHILSVIDSGEIAGESYIIMEYASGGDLRRMMRNGPLAHEQVVRVIREAASALSQAHAEGFVHRDVKPENILLDRDDRVRVADFGLAASSEASAQLAAAGAGLGTPGYMAPEQRGQLGTVKIDQRADIYSLGCLAYEMLSGRLVGPETKRSMGVFGVPKAAEASIFKAMASSPDERFDTADAFAVSLEDALLGSSLQKQFLWVVATGLLALVMVVVWQAAKPMGQRPLSIREEADQATLYLPEAEIAEARDVLLQRLEVGLKPVGVSAADVVARYDRGIDVESSENGGQLSWGEEGAVALVQRFLQSEKAEGEKAWFDLSVDYLHEGAVSRERVREVLKNDQSIWPQRWQYLQEPPEVELVSDGLIEVRVVYVHLALNARRLRKWTSRRCFGIKSGPSGAPVISRYKEEAREVLPLTEAERHVLLMYFCENYYVAGCADSEMSQLHFLGNPMFYINADKSLAEISQSFEHYHSIRPNRRLELLAMPEVERLNDDLYLIACRFEASRGEGKGVAIVTDIMQVFFEDDEPHLVYVKPIN